MRRRDVLVGMAAASAATIAAPVAASARLLATLRQPSGFSVYALAFLPDSKTFLAGDGDGALLLRDLAGKTLRAFRTDQGGINAVAVAADGKLLIAGGRLQAFARVFEVASGKLLQTFVDPKSFDWSHADEVKSVAISADGRIAASCGDKIVKLWNVETGALLHALAGHAEPVQSVAFTPDGKALLSAAADGSVRIWDAATGASLRTLAGHRRAVFSIAVTPDGASALSGALDGEMILWDLATGEKIRTFAGDSFLVNAVAITPDGRRALTASGNPLLGGKRDNVVTLWDIATGKSIRRLGTHGGSVNAVAVARDGQRALSASSDGIKLWDLGRA